MIPSKEETPFSKLRTGLEDKLSIWLIFECAFSGISLLAREIEFSGKVLCDALKQGSEDLQIILLNSIGRRPQIPSSVIALATDWLKNNRSRGIRITILKMLQRRHQALPLETLKVIEEKLKDKDLSARSAAARALGYQSALPPDILTSVATMLKDDNLDSALLAAEALQHQSGLPPDILTALQRLPKDKNTELTEAEYIRCQLDLLSSMWKCTIAEGVRSGPVEAAGNQSVSAIDALAAINASLEVNDPHVTSAIVEVRTSQRVTWFRNTFRVMEAMFGSEYEHNIFALGETDVTMGAIKRLDRITRKLPGHSFRREWLGDPALKDQLAELGAIDPEYIKPCYSNCLDESFEVHLCWYFVDGVSYLEVYRERMAMPFRGPHYQVVDAIWKAQEKIRESCIVYPPVYAPPRI